MKTIEEILEDVVEDKKDNLSTTSFKFKKDLWDFFKNIPNSNKFNCVEFGTHKGQTTRVLSYLFDQGRIYTINLPGHMDQAKLLNSDRKNISFIEMNLYPRNGIVVEPGFDHKNINVCFVDASHTTESVLMDFSRIKLFQVSDPCYVVFDDYGLENSVFVAVEQLIKFGQLEKVAYIGHEPRHSFGGFPERILKNYEGIICKLK